jgi:predicted dehydrogenase
MKTNRRKFIQSSVATGTLALGAIPLLGASPGKKFRIAIIGSGWWGMNILRTAIEYGRCKVVGVCDVYDRPLHVSADEVEGLNGDTPNKYKDYREMLRKERPEIVIIATPDHWHALPALDALEAGAHIFLEKPTGHTIQESRAILNAATSGDRIIQVGLHRRIGPHHVSAMDFLRSGKVGDIGSVRLFVTGGSGGKETPTPNSKTPTGMDWDTWCGPAPLRPYNRKLTPGGWRNFLDYANGTLGDWGVHWLDQVLWWTDEKYPKNIYSTGGRRILGPAVINDTEATSDAPDTQTAVYEFESFTATWEHRKYAGNNSEKHRIGAYFYGTNGVLHIGWRDGWTFHPKNSSQSEIHEDPRFDNEKDGHNLLPLWANFMDAIDGKAKPVAGIETSHRSSVMPLLGMLSYKLGRSIRWDGEKEQVIGDVAANQLLSRQYRAPWVYPKI